MPDEIIEIRATAARPEDSSWIEHQRKENQVTISRLEETAKYLSGLSSLNLTILLSINSEALKAYSNLIVLKLGIICWLISILFTLAVVFPFRYHYIENSAASIRSMNKKIANIKFILLIAGVILYLCGISVVAYIYLFYPTHG